jgi:hypothetical protein
VFGAAPPAPAVDLEPGVNTERKRCHTFVSLKRGRCWARVLREVASSWAGVREKPLVVGTTLRIASVPRY